MGVNMTKIMLVEDDKSLREIYGVRFQAEGYDIISAGDGEEALAMAIKEHPDLIISDVMMPKISGFDMLDILRATPETKDTKVIMMTALSSEDQRARGEALGADRYLVKSQVGIEDVVKTVHEVLSDTQKTDATPSQAFGAPAASEITTTANQPEEPVTEAPLPQLVPEPTAISESLPTPMPAFSQPASQPAPAPIAAPIQPIPTDETQLPEPVVPAYTAAPEQAIPASESAPAVDSPQAAMNAPVINEMTDRLNVDFKDGSDTSQAAATPEQTTPQQQ